MDNLQEVLHMSAGDAATSYAANSKLQGDVIANAKPVVKQSVEELCSTVVPGAQQLVVADLGCSYGPNAFTVISEVMDAVGESCRKLRQNPPPEVQFFLNDLPANDFNNIFQSLASYKKKFKEEKGEELSGRFYVAGVAGSFYGRLFPSKSVHLFHSSCSTHWLSKVPEGLKDENNKELNKGNIYIGRASPPCVHKAYLQQFQRDFTAFLRCRSEEIKDGGLMVSTIMVRTSSDPRSGTTVLMAELMAQVLKSMADEGIIKEAEIDAFNLPVYNPSIEELLAVVEDEGSFQIAGKSLMELSMDGFVGCGASASKMPSDNMRGQSAAKIMRAATEALLARHFSEENNVIDDLFARLPSILTREYEKGEEIKCPFYVFTLKKNNSLPSANCLS